MKKKTIYTNSKIKIANSDDGWQQVIPYCESPYWNECGILEGVQIFNREIADKLVVRFNSNLRKLKDWFTGANGSIPFYNGHPDHSTSELRDNNVYAYADALEARDTGLWAHIIRTENYDALKEEFGSREISPRWACEMGENQTLIPMELISFGLVEKGNLPNADVINSARVNAEADADTIKALLELLDLDDGASLDVLLSAVKALQTSVAEMETGAKNNETKIQSLETSLFTKEELIKELEKNVKELKSLIAKKEENKADEEIEKAFDDGKISPQDENELKDKQKQEDSEKTDENAVKNEDKTEDDKEDDEKDEAEKKREKLQEKIAENEKRGEDLKASQKQLLEVENNRKTFWQRVEEIEEREKCDRMTAIKICQNSMKSFE